jgi:NADH-quinone oxidoreductase subunit C
VADDAADSGEVEVEPSTPPEELFGLPVTRSHGQVVVFPTREQYVGVLARAHAEGYHSVIDLCGVDYLDHPGRSGLPEGIEPERFEVVVGLINHRERARVRLRIQVPEADPQLSSAWDHYPGTEAMEREAFDMFGIVFAGHPDLTRILMPEDWVGHPLRKDYDVGRIPVQFKGAPANR